MMSANWKVLYKHDDLPMDDLTEYVTDAVRSERMLAMTVGKEMPGPFYRAVRDTRDADSPITSWTGGRSQAALFGPKVKRHDGDMVVLAMVIHDLNHHAWIEYIGVTP